MDDLIRQRCFNHATREAVAICLECRHCFCRECITEHQDRVVCAACLSKLVSKKKEPSAKMSLVLNTFLFLGALMILWFSFYALGQFLLKLPASFHEGTLWKNLWPKM